MSVCNTDPRCSNCGAPLTDGDPAPHADGERCILCRARVTFRAPAAGLSGRRPVLGNARLEVVKL